MKKHPLSAQPREALGRKVKKLRQKGMIPATVYGKKIKSVSITILAEDFAKIQKSAGETGLIDLTLNNEVLPVLIHHIQIDPVYGHLLHIEFHQVDLKEKVITRVPLVLTGQSSAVTQKLGVMLSVLDEIEVEALPTELPEHISVDISTLNQVNDEIKVSDLQTPGEIAVLTGPDLTVVKIAPLVTKEAEAQVAAEEAAAAAAKTTEAEQAPASEPTPTAEPQPAAKEEKPETK